LLTYACVGINDATHVFYVSSLSLDIGGHQTQSIHTEESATDGPIFVMNERIIFWLFLAQAGAK